MNGEKRRERGGDERRPAPDRAQRRAGRRAGSSPRPAISDGARSSSGVRSIRVVSHDATKYSGGVISASVWTIEITSPSPRPATM